MSARILVVDDIETNLKLLEARLSAEYFTVLTARSGPEALEICEREPVDLVLLDVMMPDMDGFEVCRRLKAAPSTMHLPVVLITALDQKADRLAGLQAGADDFLTKPVRDLPLLSRVKSLTRLKLLTDELRGRSQTAFDLLSPGRRQSGDEGARGRILIADDRRSSALKLQQVLARFHDVHLAGTVEDAVRGGREEPVDLFVVNTVGTRFDPLRLCAVLRSGAETRLKPILLVADEDDEVRIAKALDIGVSDYVTRPVDPSELLARVRTQLRRARYDRAMRQNLEETIELAVRDPLTGLHNRRFLETHLVKAIERARAAGRPLATLIVDIDHFKRINDGWGHDAGDKVLKEFAARLRSTLRASDLACRFGGEEFVVMMPDADARMAEAIAERLRRQVQETPFDLAGESISVTVSAGYSVLDPAGDDMDSLLKRADRGLYAAKQAGRNRVVSLAA